MGSLVAELAEKLSSATNSIDFDEQTLFLNTSANTVGVGTNAPASKFDVRGTMQVGINDTGYDVKFFGDTAGKYWLWDTSADGTVQVGNSQLTGTLTVGVNDTGHDVTFFGDTASKYWLWDTSADGTVLVGSSTQTGNAQLTGTLTVGVDDTGHDVKFFGATATNGYMLWDESTDDLILGSASKIGIGSVSPYGALDIQTTGRCQIVSTITNDAALWVSNSGAETGGSALQIYSNSAHTGGRTVCTITQDHASASAATCLKIVQDGAGDIVSFWDAGTEVFTIDDVGNVGIGTSAPAAFLDVKTTASSELTATAIIRTSADANPAYCSLQFHSGAGALSQISGKQLSGEASGGLAFYTRANDAGALTERMIIRDSGKVGIGTTEPTCPLSIQATHATSPNTCLHLLSTNGANWYLHPNATDTDLHFNYNAGVDVMALSNNGHIHMVNLGAETGHTAVGWRSSDGMILKLSSSRRYKENIVDSVIDSSEILGIKLRDYDWKESGKHLTGFIAEELYELLPNAVILADVEGEEEQQPESIDFQSLTCILIDQVQKMATRITTLENA